MSDISNAVIQKQTRQIYDALENNNPKFATAILQKCLKKAPNIPIYKILNALTLTSMGRITQANEIIDSILTNDFLEITNIIALNSLVSTLKALDRNGECLFVLERIFQLYPENEEFGVEMFYASIRALEFKKANTTALKLFKKYNRQLHYIWSILALYNYMQLSSYGPESSEQSKEVKLSLNVTDKMIVKALNEGKFQTFQEYSTCLLLGAIDENILKMLLDVPVSIFPSVQDSIKWKLSLLQNQKNWNAIVDLVRTSTPVFIILSHWESFLIYLDAVEKIRDMSSIEDNFADISFWKLHSSEIIDVPDTSPTSLNRAALLADLEISIRFERENPPKLLISSIHKYFESAFGSKDSCFSDLLPYLSKANQSDYFCNFLVTCKSSPPALSISDKTKLLNALKIEKFYSQSKTGVDLYSSIFTFDEYIDMYYSWKSPSENYVPTDLILLAISDILQNYLQDGNVRALYDIAILLRRAIIENETNFYCKLLLIFIFRELGGVSIALEIYKSLNIKNIQLDMLGYLILDWLPTIGFAESVLAFCDEVDDIYESNAADTPSMLVEAYRFGSFSQIPEFLDFYCQMKYSIQKKVTEFSRIQAKLVGLKTKSDLAQFFFELELPLLQKTLMDNRPQEELFSSWRFFGSFSKFTRRNSAKNTNWLESCNAILIAMKFCYGFRITGVSDKLDIGPKTLGNDNSLLQKQVELILKDLTITEDLPKTVRLKEDWGDIPTDASHSVGTILGGLLAVVYAAYRQSFSEEMPERINDLLNIIDNTILELLNSITIINSDVDGQIICNPDTILLQLEGIVQCLHYTTVFCMGVSHQGKVNQRLRLISQKIVFTLDRLLNIPENVILPSIPSYVIKDDAALGDSLAKDWKQIWQSSRHILEICRCLFKTF